MINGWLDFGETGVGGGVGLGAGYAGVHHTTAAANSPGTCLVYFPVMQISTSLVSLLPRGIEQQRRKLRLHAYDGRL
jgi:hypothetical protein